jgi:phage-related minor tail protein
LSFKDFADSIIKDLARIAYQKAIAGIFDMVLNAFAPSNSSGYIGGNGTGGYGMEMQNAGSGGQYGLSFGGGRASGGSTTGGTIYEVAEGGKPELYQSAGRTYLLSGNDGHVTPARSSAVAGISAGGGINVVIENHTDVRPQVSHSTGANGQPLIKILMKQVDDRMTQNAANPSSQFGKALSGVYGLRRRGVPASS